MVNVPTIDELAAVELAARESEAALGVRIDGLTARLADLEDRPSTPPPPAPWVGAAVAPAPNTSDYQTPWEALDAAVGPLRYPRMFDSTIKPPGQERWRKIADSVPFYSVKPPGGDVQGFIDGLYTEQFQEMVLELPAGSRLAVYHEPEDNLTGETFYLLTERAVNDLRAVRPAGVTYCMVPMAYQYETNSKGLVLTLSGQLQPGWLDAAKLVDELDLDVYASGPNDAQPIRSDAGAQRFLDLLVGPSGRPWGIAERGIYAHPGRVKMLFADWRFVCETGGRLFLYWNAQLQQYTYPLTDPGELAAFGRIAAQGRAR